MKKNNYVNKTVIRKINTPKEFTIVQNSILTDNRLTATAHRILTSMLSDADSFKVSYKLFENRFNLAKKTVKAAFENLEKYGYVSRKKMPRGFYYTISEFGNLKPQNKEPEPQVNNKELETKIEIAEKQVEDYLSSYSDLVLVNQDVILDLMGKHTNNDNLINFYEFKIEADAHFKTLKDLIFNEAFKLTETLSKHYSKKAIKQYKEWLNTEIYQNNRLLELTECKKQWRIIKSKNYNFKTDFETARFDKAEQDYYDNQ